MKKIKCRFCKSIDEYDLTEIGTAQCTKCEKFIWVGRKDGSPAFPVIDESGDTWEGMSLRDYFAGRALAGQIASSFNLNGEQHAKRAYKIADAMIKERDNG